jgi:hypothetical protein
MSQRSDSGNASRPLGQLWRRRRKRQRVGAMRAFTAARLLAGLPVRPRTQAQAALLVASSTTYVRAAVAVLEAENPELIERVLRGDVGLLAAAATVRKRARLVKAYRDADRSDRKALGEVVGVANIFDEAVVPLL